MTEQNQHSDREAQVIDVILFALFYGLPTLLAVVSLGWWALRG